MTIKNSVTELENFKNTGNLDVQGISMNGVDLAPAAPGTAEASKMLVTDENNDLAGIDVLTVDESFVIGSANMSEVDLEKLDGITNGTAAANKAVVLTTDNAIDDLKIAAIRTGYAAKTAGTTQTQAGATLITTTITGATVGNEDDGLLLPAMTAGRVLFINNLSANAGKVYGNAAETLNGTAGSSGSVALTASGMAIVYATAAGVSILKNLI